MISRSVSSRVLTNFNSYASRRDLNPAKLLAECGLRRADAQYQSPPVSFADVEMLFERAAAVLKDDAFGLQFALDPSDEYRCVEAEFAGNSATLGEALRNLARYFLLGTNAFDGDLTVSSRNAVFAFEFASDSHPKPQIEGYIVGRLLVWIRKILRDDTYVPRRIEFQQSRPRQFAHYRTDLSTKILFNAPATAVVFDRTSMDTPIPRADPVLFKKLAAIVEAKLRVHITSQRLIRDAQSKIIEILPRGRITTSEIAAALRVSPRTFQRSLAVEGVKFRELLDDIRKAKAEHLLAETQLPLTEIAFQLGFSELSAFSRAAKAWFGYSPQHMRDRLKQHTGTEH